MIINAFSKKKKKNYLASFIVEDAFRIFEHLLSPKVEEIIRIRVEFEPVLPVVPDKEMKSKVDLIKSLVKGQYLGRINFNRIQNERPGRDG